LINHRRAAGDDGSFWIIVGPSDLSPLACAIDIGLALFERLLIVRRTDEMMVAATWIVPIEFRFDAWCNNLEFEAFIFRGKVTRNEPVQSEHRLGTLDHQFGAASSHRCHRSSPINAGNQRLTASPKSVYSILRNG